MKLIDNVSSLLGDDLKTTIRPGSRLRIAASCFSIYAFDSLDEVRDYATKWLWFYNHERPNKANGGLPPKRMLAAA